jgi:hypothetical protein
VIAFLVTNRHRYTIEGFLDWWAPTLRHLIRVSPYDRLDGVRELPPATYVFADLERLSDEQARVARSARERLTDRYERPSVLNDPTAALVRHDLLRELKDEGINDFSTYRVADTRTPERFPVFVREVHAHSGSLTPLLHTQQELDAALARIFVRRRPSDLLMIEFCDTSGEDGIFRKYGAFIVGDRIIARHVFFSRDWKVKSSALVGEEQLREEGAYLATNPHEKELKRIFAIAGITYGRVDYGLRDERIQVWEINTNPMVIPPADRKKHPVRRAFKERCAEQIAEALQEVDARGRACYGTTPSAHDMAVLPEVRYEWWRRFRHRLGSYPVVRRPYELARKRRALWVGITDRLVDVVPRPMKTLLQKKSE